MEELVAFASAGTTLFGVLSVPEGETPARGVVLVHGWSTGRSGPHEMFVHLARAFARGGIAALRFDLAGRGNSDGDYNATSVDLMIQNTADASAFIRQRFGLDSNAVAGICSGGNVAIGAAITDTRIDKIIALSTLPFTEPEAAADGDFKANIKKSSSSLRSYVRKVYSAESWRKFFRGEINFSMIKKTLFGHFRRDVGTVGKKISAIDVMGRLKDYGGSVLFIYGSNDPDAKEAEAHYRGFADASGIQSDVLIIDGANHNFYSLAWEQKIAGRILSFMN